MTKTHHDIEQESFKESYHRIVSVLPEWIWFRFTREAHDTNSLTLRLGDRAARSTFSTSPTVAKRFAEEVLKGLVENSPVGYQKLFAHLSGEDPGCTVARVNVRPGYDTAVVFEDQTGRAFLAIEHRLREGYIYFAYSPGTNHLMISQEIDLPVEATI